ncbi:MAG: hypothetical protein GY789_19400 [Hyphomicrobiales bacterium]|nr:hypothetical protein [Hyphomicrobiales bacterium]MCP5000576.1 hypothetical protein [Hyphomicrobiales bacterium]
MTLLNPVFTSVIAVWRTSGWPPIAYNVLLTDVALLEYVGLLQYDTYNMMGWNPPPVQQKTGS